jgi:hypothetical protein
LMGGSVCFVGLDFCKWMESKRPKPMCLEYLVGGQEKSEWRVFNLMMNVWLYVLVYIGNKIVTMTKFWYFFINFFYYWQLSKSINIFFYFDK